MLRVLRHRQARAALQWASCELGLIRTMLESGGATRENSSEIKGTTDFGFQEVPVEEKETLVGQVFSSVAPSYDVMNDLMSGGLHRLWKDWLVEFLAPCAGVQHLDIAGGTGDVAFRVFRAIRDAEGAEPPAYCATTASHADPLPRSPPDKAAEIWASDTRPPCGSVTVCDINAAMLQEGEKKAAAQGIAAGGMSWVQGNAEALPFPDAAFDSCTIAFGIRNVTDRMAALREALRVLRPGGRFLCLEFSKVMVPEMQQFYDLYSFSVIPEIGRVVAGDAESYRYLVESIRMFPGQEEFAGMLRGAGFSSVRYESFAGGVVAVHSGMKPRR